MNGWRTERSRPSWSSLGSQSSEYSRGVEVERPVRLLDPVHLISSRLVSSTSQQTPLRLITPHPHTGPFRLALASDTVFIFHLIEPLSFISSHLVPHVLELALSPFISARSRSSECIHSCIASMSMHSSVNGTPHPTRSIFVYKFDLRHAPNGSVPEPIPTPTLRTSVYSVQRHYHQFNGLLSPHALVHTPMSLVKVHVCSSLASCPYTRVHAAPPLHEAEGSQMGNGQLTSAQYMISVKNIYLLSSRESNRVS